MKYICRRKRAGYCDGAPTRHFTMYGCIYAYILDRKTLNRYSGPCLRTGKKVNMISYKSTKKEARMLEDI